MRMTVAELICETHVTIGPDCSTDDALEAFYEFETPELYVVDGSGMFLGVLPDYELLKVELSGEARISTVDQLMSSSVPVVSPDTDAAEVARQFRSSHCSRIPVVKAGRLVGVVTRADLIRLMAVFRRLESEQKPNKVGPKAPKILRDFLSTPTSASRSKSTTPRKRVAERRTQPARRATSTRSGR